MNSRIHYIKTETPHILKSKHKILCSSYFVVVYINTMKYHWYIINTATNKKVTEGHNSSLRKIKKDVKDALVFLGAHFFEEVRKKGMKL